MKKLFIFVIMFLVVMFCVKWFDVIVLVDIFMGVYIGESCEGLVRELVKEQQNFVVVFKEQN